MLVCNCTLAGSKACLRCPEYIKYFGETFDWQQWYWPTYTGLTTIVKENYEVVDKDKFDIIEKKDAKIARLKEELDLLQKTLDGRNKLLDEEILRMEKMKVDIEKLTKELKELEDK